MVATTYRLPLVRAGAEQLGRAGEIATAIRRIQSSTGFSELPQVRLHYDDFDRRNMSKQITTEVPVLLLRHPIRECFI